jgi:hypothetical protein
MNITQNDVGRPRELPTGSDPETRSLETTIVRLAALEHDLEVSAEATRHETRDEEARAIVMASIAMHRHHVCVIRRIIQKLGFVPPGGGDLRSAFYRGTIVTAAESHGSVLDAFDKNLEHAMSQYDHALDGLSGPAAVVLELRQARMNLRLLRDHVTAARSRSE